MVKKTASNIENENLVAILAYLIVGIIWYFVDDKITKKSAFAKYHVKQALNLMIISIAISFAASILMIPFFFMIPVIWFIVWVIQIILIVLWIIGIISAINHKKKQIPIIGQFAERYLTF